jgi:hypothetical protein
MRRYRSILAAAIVVAAIGAISAANSAELKLAAVKAKPVVESPFFLVNDNRLTYAYQFTATSPGATNKTAKQIYAFTHFDVWAYGTNFINLDLAKSDHADPAAPCPVLQPSGCAGSAEFYGLIRSTFGFNEIFDTKAFAMGPLRNVSFVIGADGETQNTFLAPNKKDVVAGLQFAFDLPYKGFLNVNPLYYQEGNHNSYLTPGFVPAGFAGIADGNTHYDPTWAVELNYYRDLGFLPPSVQYFAISGRAGFYGPKGTGAAAGVVPQSNNTKWRSIASQSA